MWEPTGDEETPAREIAGGTGGGRDAARLNHLPAGYHPTRVVLYTWGRERGTPPRPLVEYQWSQAEGVTCTVLDHQCAAKARRFMKQGANFERERRMVLPEEGPVFMRALLGHGNSSSYYWFLDRTPEA
ncbi:MAG: hypothetical protein ABW224_07320 [Kibdelosporangium sp.]